MQRPPQRIVRSRRYSLEKSACRWIAGGCFMKETFHPVITGHQPSYDNAKAGSSSGAASPDYDDSFGARYTSRMTGLYGNHSIKTPTSLKDIDSAVWGGIASTFARPGGLWQALAPVRRRSFRHLPCKLHAAHSDAEDWFTTDYPGRRGQGSGLHKRKVVF
jgi:hypothetical protein